MGEWHSAAVSRVPSLLVGIASPIVVVVVDIA